MRQHTALGCPRTSDEPRAFHSAQKPEGDLSIIRCRDQAPHSPVRRQDKPPTLPFGVQRQADCSELSRALSAAHRLVSNVPSPASATFGSLTETATLHNHSSRKVRLEFQLIVRREKYAFADNKKPSEAVGRTQLGPLPSQPTQTGSAVGGSQRGKMLTRPHFVMAPRVSG